MTTQISPIQSHTVPQFVTAKPVSVHGGKMTILNNFNNVVHHIKWADMARIYKAMVSNDESLLGQAGWSPKSIATAHNFANSTWAEGRSGWSGGSSDDAISYLENGYKVGEMLADFLPGVLMRTREGSAQRSRWIYGDAGDEIDIGEALNGNIDCFRRVEQSPTIGGLNVRLHVAMTGETDAEVFAQLGAWVARLLATAQGANISPSLEFVKRNSFIRKNDKRTHAMIIRVKHEGEALDWAAYSALFSPVGYRHFGFATIIRTAAEAGGAGGRTPIEVDALGQPQGASDWGLAFDRPTRTLQVFSPAYSSEFPTEKMTRLLIETGALSNA